MIDDMVAVLKKEQEDDESKKEFCGKELDASDDKKKELDLAISESEMAISTAEDSIAALAGEIEALVAGIKELDESVAKATNMRKEQHADFVESIKDNSAAKEILEFAKNRLNKFYNPKLYVPVLVQSKDAPPPPPESFKAYSQNHHESTGVISMIDSLIKDLDKDITVAETEEK